VSCGGITAFRIAQEDAKNANWHMHMLLYGLILLLMDNVLGQPAENEPGAGQAHRRWSTGSSRALARSKPRLVRADANSNPPLG
jgi:hypothetical protein